MFSSNNEDSYIDDYEYNEVVDDAFDLLGPNNGIIDGNYYEMDEYSLSIDGTLDMNDGFKDKDYYYITVLTDSNIQIFAHTEREYDGYDFIIFKEEYVWSSDGSVSQERVELYYNCDEYSSKQFEFFALPGTYYIYFGGQQPLNSTYVLQYSLNIFVQKVEASLDANIDDMMFNKELDGAIWISDFAPANLFERGQLSLDTEIVYYKESDNSITTKDHALEDLKNIAGDNPIHFASVYLWDPYLRYSFYKILSCVIELVEENFELSQTKIKNITLLYQIETVGISSVQILVKNFAPIIVRIPAQILMNVSQSSLDFLFETYVVNVEKTEEKFLSFLNVLKATVNVGIGDDEDGSLTDEEIYEIVSSYSNFETIVELPIYYKLIVRKSICSNYDEYVISFYEGAIAHYNEDKNYYYSGENILANNNVNNFYCGGKVYSFNESADFESLELVENIPNVVKTPIDVNYDVPKAINPLHEGEYVWFKFTVPTTDTYYFLCKGNENNNLRIELFECIVTGYSYQDIIKSNTGGYISNTDTDVGSYFSINLSAGDTIYIRISGNDFSKVEEPSVFLISYDPAHGVEHIHDYSEVNYYDGTRHIYCCDCDDFIFEQHIVKNGSNVCIVCKTKIDKGIIQW